MLVYLGNQNTVATYHTLKVKFAACDLLMYPKGIKHREYTPGNIRHTH